MKQYHDHLKTILESGTKKPAARKGMPGSISLFGYQNRYNLQDGFPILTTKEINFKNIVVELLWFLRGDTNIRYLVQNGCNIWNGDAYNYYLKHNGLDPDDINAKDFETFMDYVKMFDINLDDEVLSDYTFGDCGYQYGKVWRSWEQPYSSGSGNYDDIGVDQIRNIIDSLKNSPEGRRHVVSAIDPIHDNDLALYWCHCLFQFNARPLNDFERTDLAWKMGYEEEYRIAGANKGKMSDEWNQWFDEKGIPKYYLDCHLYQRSADMFLGVPYNISSYALLTNIIAGIVGMIPGEFIHTFGDSHIYDNHIDQVKEILSRDTEKYPLPNLKINVDLSTFEKSTGADFDLMNPNDFELENYQSYEKISAKLSTGLV